MLEPSADGHLVFTADGYPTAIRVSEEGLQSRVHWENQNRRSAHAPQGSSSIGTMQRPRSLALALAGLAASLLTALALATPAGARGDPPFTVKVAKEKDGQYRDGFTDINL